MPLSNLFAWRTAWVLLIVRYRGEVKIPLYNDGLVPRVIRRGERIAQIVILNVELNGWDVVDKLPETTRGEGGFGSTGV